GAKLSAPFADQEIPSPEGGSDVAAEDSSLVDSHGGGGGGSSSISDYLTNICPGWRVEDLLLDDAAFAAAAAAKGRDEQVPFLDADLFDVVAGRPEK
ncbi:hypothetical protein P5E87_15785, partial [Clostridium perfringens]|nr:hypothetical protein [Clostridium perfringens]